MGLTYSSGDGTDATDLAAPSAPAGRRGFPAEAAAVLHRLRTALAAVVDAIPGRVAKPAELQRALQVDFKLSCKVLRVLSAPGPLAAGPHVPGQSALRAFLAAAAKAGIADKLVSAASGAAGEFDRLVASHAGDRTVFDSMISSLAERDDARQITTQHRRAAYRAQSHIFGLQARVELKCMVVQPAEEPRKLDLARVSGFVSLRQLHPEAPLVIPCAHVVNDDGSVRAVQRELLDPTGDPRLGIGLMAEFCSRPTPRFRDVPSETGMGYGELISQGLGMEAAMTILEGELVRGAAPRYCDEQNKYGVIFSRVRVPCEVLLLDMLVREDTYGLLKPRVYARAEQYRELPYLRILDEARQLEPPETVAYLGKGCAALYTPDVPRYAELGRLACERLGADPERFDVYRCRVEYPVLPSTVALTFELPEE